MLKWLAINKQMSLCLPHSQQATRDDEVVRIEWCLGPQNRGGRRGKTEGEGKE